MDNKLIQGMLIGTFLLTLFATLTTVAEIRVYNRAPGTSAVGAEVATAPKAAGLAAYAPEGAFGFVKVDVRKIRNASFVPKIKELLPPQEEGAPDPSKGVEQVALFFLPGAAAGPGQEPSVDVSGVIKVSGSAFEAELAKKATQVTVGDLSAYKIAADAVETMPLPVSLPKGKEALLAKADDSTFILGSSEDVLRKAMNAYRGEGRARLSAAQDLASPYAADAVSGGFALPEAIRKQIAASPETPEWAKNIEGVAVGFSVASGLELKALVELGSSETAGQAAKEVNAKWAPAKEQMKGKAQMMFPPAAGLLDNIEIVARGSALHAEFKISSADLDTLITEIGKQIKQQMQGAMGGTASSIPTRP